MSRSRAWRIGLALSALAGVAPLGSAWAQPGEVIPFPKAGQGQVVPQPGVEAAPGAPTPGACAPPKLFRTTIRNITPGLQAADRRAQPRQIWRQGSLFLRSVEQPIPPNGDQQVAIVAEPDIWMVNEATRTGQHSRDPGPVFEVRAPILPVAPDVPPLFRGLEFGCEADFVAANAPQPARMVSWGSIQATLHMVTAGDHSLAILMDGRRREPLMLSYLRQGKPVFVLRYDDYQHGLPDRPQLFQPSPQTRIVEAQAKPTGQQPPLQPAPGEKPF